MSENITQAETIADEAETPAEGHATTAETVGEQKQSERSFSQAEVNDLIRARLAEEKARATKRFEADLAAKLAAKDQDLEKLLEDRLAERLRQQELDRTRAAISQEFGLSERQMAVLAGESPEELRAAAEELFGSIRRPQAPRVPTGGSGAQGVNGPTLVTQAQMSDFSWVQSYGGSVKLANDLRTGHAQIVD